LIPPLRQCLPFAYPRLKNLNLALQTRQLFVQQGEAVAAAEVKTIKKIRNALDAPRDDLDVLAIRPVLLNLLLKVFVHGGALQCLLDGGLLLHVVVVVVRRGVLLLVVVVVV